MKHDLPKAIEFELEIVMAGYGKPDEEGSVTLSENFEESAEYSVELHLRLEQTGQIELLYEREFKTQQEAEDCFAMLEEMFPDASHNIVPD